MKKLIPVFAIVLLFSVFTSTPVEARSKPRTSAHMNEADVERARQLTARLEEIKAIDRSTLDRSEKRELRMEVRSIKKEMETLSGGVYISIGALLIIVLLILLL